MPRAPRGEFKGLTFDDLVRLKEKSRDPLEQKRIRRAIRELRAKDETLPTLTRGISADSGITQLPPGVDLEDVHTYRQANVRQWTEEMHFKWIDWNAANNPLHQPARIDHTGKPVYGCMCSGCSRMNGELFDALVAEDLPVIISLYEKRSLTESVRKSLIKSAKVFLRRPKSKKAKKSKGKKS